MKTAQSLIQKKCTPARDGEGVVLSRKEAQDYHTQIKQWTLHQKSLEREFRFKNFQESMAFLNKVATIAEQESHHPDVSIFYGRVRLQLTTHTLSGLTLNDFIMAAKIDKTL